MTTSISPTTTPSLSKDSARSLLDGVDAAACKILGLKGLRHRSALLALSDRTRLPHGVVGAVHAAITTNWTHCQTAGAPTKSNENWRWRVPKLGLSARNASPEVMLERALVGACERSGRVDWANQVPIASGIGGPARQRRRALDLVHQRSPGHFEFVELKIASDTPLYAAIEIISYTCIWLLSRAGVTPEDNPLLAARSVDACVLAPAAYYARYDLGRLERLFDEELAALGRQHDVQLRFRFETFADELALPPFADAAMLALLDQRQSL